MNKFSLILTVIAAMLVLCQWYTFQFIRTYLFQKTEKITRKIAYPVLILFGAVTILAARLEYGSEVFAPGTWERQSAAIIVFSYLGWTVLVSILFLMAQICEFLSAMNRKILCTMPAGETRSTDQRGSLGNELKALEPACKESTCDRPVYGSEQSGMPGWPKSTRRAFLKVAAASGLTAAAVVGIRGVAEAYGTPEVIGHNFSPVGIDGFENSIDLIHATDFHYGLFVGDRELEILVDRLNSIKADLLCITGDVFHSGRTAIEQSVPILKKLRPRSLGNFAVIGNHDVYAGEARTMDSLESAGITMLRNRWIAFEKTNSTIHVGGVDDPAAERYKKKERSGIANFINNIPSEDGLRILLSHRPAIFPEAAKRKVHLVLAGHLHGGQIVLPAPWHERGISAADLFSGYTYGWYSENLSSMYVSRGIGLTFLPWRINCAPEISVIRIDPARA